MCCGGAQREREREREMNILILQKEETQEKALNFSGSIIREFSI